MWPRRQQDAGGKQPASKRSDVMGRHQGAPPPLSRPSSAPATSKWAPRRAAPSGNGPTEVKKAAAASRSEGDDAAWLLRAVEKKKKKKARKTQAETTTAADKQAAGVKRPRTEASADCLTASDGGKSKQKSKKSLVTQSWRQRQQQWRASAKRKDAAAVSAEERARAEQQQEGFELVFQEVFGRQKQQQQQQQQQQAATSVPSAVANRPVTSRVLESSDDEDDDEGVEQRSLALPQLASSTAAPASQPLPGNNNANDKSDDAGHDDEGEEDDAWTFSTADSALRLDDFDAKDGEDATGSGADSAAGRAAFARWKEEDASHAVGNNFVKLNMRKRFRGSSGKAKKLPAYLRARGERLDDVTTGDAPSTSRKPRDQQQLAGNGGLMNDGLDFIDECLQVLARVECERAARDQAAKGDAATPTADDSQEATGNTEDPPPPRCHHALACQQLVVKKKNKNHGRAFFACPLGFDEGRCDFFLWQDNHVQLALRHLFTASDAGSSGTSGSDEYVPLDSSRPMQEQQDALLTNLRLVFGHARFRPGQEWAISRVFAQRNTLLVLPTGAGKSLCYQLPALFLPGVTLVISPLISLMNDQFERLPPALKQQAACLASSSSTASSKARYAEFVRDLLGGRLKLVFLSPERALGSGMQRLLASIRARISLVCVDEAHCVSEWSHHFRPSYLRLARVFRHAKCVLAMTATASRRVVDDVVAQLVRHQRRSETPVAAATDDGERMVLQLPWQRSNLQLRVRSVASDEQRTTQLCRFLSSKAATGSGGGVIVYVHQQRQTEELARVLTEQLPRLKVGYYHAKMDAEHKEKVRVGFLRGKLRVVVATIAFGMGIDKQNVRGVVHFHMPASAENYLQQVGRAGRDGKPARALLFLAPQDARLFRSLAFSNALHADQLRRLVELVLLAGNGGSALSGSDEHAVAVSECAIGGGESHWLTLDVQWAECALDMKDAMIETFLTLLAQKLPSERADAQAAAAKAGVSLLPTGAARCRVLLADKQLRSLPADSVVRRLLRVIDQVDKDAAARHASVEREVNGYLSTVTACFHIQEMAHALFGRSAGSVMTDYYRPATDEDDDQVARAQRQLLQLLRQAQLNGQVQRVTLEAPAFHVKIQHEPGACISSKQALASAVARELFVQHEKMEERQLARLARLYAALSAAAVPVDSGHQRDVEDGEEDEEKAQALEHKLSRYFQDEEDGDGADEEEAADQKLLGQVLEPLTASTVEQIERDARALVTLTRRDVESAGDEGNADEEDDERLPWTCFSVARIFHGLGSPAFPVRQWRQHPHWRKYDAVAFEKLARVADRVLHEGGDDERDRRSTLTDEKV